MSRQAIVYTVAIASPSDTENERKALPEVIYAWNATHSQATVVMLQPVMWETHATPEMGDRPQAIINRQLIRDADVLVAVFWTRLGTPTGEAESGTVEEIEEFRRAGKPVLLYFSDAPAIPSKVNREQYERLEEFREQCQEEGLVARYESIGELREKFARHLTHTVRRLEEERGEEFSEAADARPDVTARRALRSEFEKLVRRVAAEWAAERDSEPLGIDGGKAIMERAFTALIDLQGELPDTVSGAAETMASAGKRMRALRQHQLMMDGNMSYDAFWKEGNEIIDQLRQVTPHLADPATPVMTPSEGSPARVADEAWQGVQVGARFYAWDGPLDDLEDRTAVVVPLELDPALKKALDDAGVQASWRNMTSAIHLGPVQQLFITDRRTYKRAIISGNEVVLVVRPLP